MGIDKILIADPDFKFLARLKEGLLQFGQFEILTAHNGRQALDILEKNEISILVTDIFMPQVDGLELLAAITRQFPNVLSIVTTSQNKGILQKKTTGDSLFSYLRKPYDHIRLHTELIKVLDCLDEIYFKAGIYLGSMLPLVHIGKKSCLLVVSSEDNKTGSFTFDKGILREACYKDLRGEDAVREMLAWGPGKYTFKDQPKAQVAGEVNGDLTSLIFEGTGLVPLGDNLSKSIKVNLQPKPEQPAGVKETVSLRPPEINDRKNTHGKPGRQAQATISEQVVTKKHETKPLPPYSHCRVLIVDDSKMIRKGLLKILSSDATLEIVGEASNGREALDLIKQHKPDVVTLDINMPVMDGLSTLKHMMIQCPTPTVMLSTLTYEGTAVTFDTLKYGAVDFMPKPSSIISEDMHSQAFEIIKKIHLAAGVKIESVKYIRSIEALKKDTGQIRIKCERVVCIGAAEGGYGALLKIIPKLSTELPAAYIVMIHANPQHVDAFVNYLSRHSPMRIQRARDGLILEGATCYLASGREHTILHGQNSESLSLKINLVPHSPDRTSINMLMCSMAEVLKDKSIGVVLSGSGNDGASGLQSIKKAGGTSIVQNPANCLYKEMAEQAMKCVDRQKILPESKISETINKLCLHGP